MFMSESLQTNRYETHTIYTKADFTAEEYDRGNRIALAVIDGGLNICKVCGEYDQGLFDNYCKWRK